MAKNYIGAIQRLDWAGLRALWQQIVGGTTAPRWASGKALEHLVLRALELSGATVTWPYSVKLADQIVEQIDGAAYLGGRAYLVECKDTANASNIEPIAKLRNQLIRRPAGTVGIVFSRSGYTEPALTLAQYLAPQTVLLWEGDEISYALDNEDFARFLEKKFRFAVEQALPNYNILEEAVP